MQELVRRIGDDERRHMAWGTFTCRRHVAADDANWAVFEHRMTELIPTAMQTIVEFFAPFADGRVPFGLAPDEFTAYAQDKGLRRIGTIGSARHRPVAELDVDYAPVELEETFAAEDAQELAAAEAP